MNRSIKKIAFQGRHGAYSEKACRQLFGEEVETLPCDYFEDVFLKVQSGVADFGVLPIENSTAGSIHENYDLLLKYRLPIYAETKVRVEHVLMAPIGAALEKLREVHSHPQALAQCSHFFQQRPDISQVPAYDTAGSAEEIAQSADLQRGAIASAEAAEVYGLQVLLHSLENFPGSNVTRFFAVGREEAQQMNAVDKMSIAFSPREEHSGVLYEALGALARRDINLTRIESRPHPDNAWQYIFYLDFMGSEGEKRIQDALEELKNWSSALHILGSYQAAVEE
jgi:prephenate dehydratase